MFRHAWYLGYWNSLKLWLMYKQIIPRPDMEGLEVGDIVIVADPDLNYDDNIGVIIADESPEIFQWQYQFLYVEFPEIDFREYFVPSELKKAYA